MAARTSTLVRSGLACLGLAAAASLYAQSPSPAPPPSPQDSTPVFRATSRLVLLDIVVTDHRGQFIPGLKPADFTILEDGRPQKVSAFSVHVTPAAPRHVYPPLQLPPHQFSNFTRVPQQTDRPLTIVLLDMLNTTGGDQQRARKQMIEFLKSLPGGHPVALFTLTSKLEMVQGFTDDSAMLVQAATAVLTKTLPLMGSETQTQQEEIRARSLEIIASPSNASASSIAPIGDAIRKAYDSQDTFQKLQRIDYTIDALTVLARSVAGYSGRKSLLWLSAEFPVAFGPELNPYQSSGSITGVSRLDNPSRSDLHDEAPPLRETAALLTAAQVAVYPIDVGGVANPGTGIDISTPTSNLSNFDLKNETQAAVQRQATARWDAHEVMNDIARETGGEAIYGTNDLKEALSRAMDQSSNYYTLAYSPANADWSGKYRKLEVKTDTSGTKLIYRRGYYALAQRPYTGDKAAAAMAVAMKFSMPELTMLLLKVQVLPPDAEHKTVRIDYAVDPRDIAFTDGADQRRRASIDFIATAWDRDLKLIAHQADTMDTNLRPEPYQQIMQTGLPFHQELTLKPGSYTLRLGVLDRGSEKIGTVDVPLTIPGNSSSAAATLSR